MTYIYTFMCKLANGCGAVIKVRTDTRHWDHPWLKCPVCHGNAQRTSKK